MGVGQEAQKPVIAAPTELLSTSTAKTYKHIHPVLVLTLLYATFGHVVADPVTSLLYLLVPLCVLQSLYCVLCLPPSSSAPSSATAQSSNSSKAATQLTPKRKGASSSNKSASLSSKLTSSLIATTLSLVVIPPVFFIVVVLHGAPLTTHHAHTALLALHLSVLSSPALFYAHGVSGACWRELVSLSAPVDELLGGAIGACVGAWLGAIPIPLDWDREWQKWPVTVVAGSYAGWAVGRLLGGWLLKGKKIEFEA